MRILTAAVIVTASLTAALAHEARKGPNGGLLVDAGKNYHVELIAKGSDEVVVILSDASDKPVPSAGFKGNAILIVDGKTLRFPLQPADGSRLVGKAPTVVPATVKGAIQLTAPDGVTAQAKF